MAYSKWLKTDLHIHSHISNQTKLHDYEGSELTYEKLVTALVKKQINIFSITDHNTINIPLYSELLSNREDLVKQNINFVIGAEVDFEDKRVHDKVFHMLVYFDTCDLDRIAKIFVDMYNKNNINEIDIDTQPISLDVFFNAVFDNGIQNIITIPHFNKKEKGLPPRDQIDRFVYTVFNALEDSNNRENLIRAINAFKNFNYNDVPIVVFSDNHNIDIYPRSKSGDLSKQTSMYILGNINYPFSSIKTAFQDVNTRISIEGLEMRSSTSAHKYIKSVTIDQTTIPLSEYQNTIIGGFGSGKSFFLNMLLYGKKNIKEQYRDLANKYEQFTFTFSDGTTRESLSQLEDEIRIIQFDQRKDIYFKNVLLEEDKNYLEKQLHVEFPSMDTVNEIEEIELKDCFNRLKQNCENTSSITDIINYDALNRKNEKSYSFNVEELQPIYESPVYLEALLNNLELEIHRKVLFKPLYSDSEVNNISTTKGIISTKDNNYRIISEKFNSLVDKLSLKIKNVNEEVHRSNSLISGSIKVFDDIKEDLTTYIHLLKGLKSKAFEFENRYSEEKYNELKSKKQINNLFSYQLIAKYLVNNNYIDYIQYIIKSQYRSGNLFKGIIRTLNAKDSFAYNKTFEQRIDQYTEEYYNNFKTVCYDICENGESILKKSAGEKANIIMNIIFDIIEEYSSKGISSIIVLDQPEDNLDNKGIKNRIVNRIRSLKIKNRLPQLICVTHNANISITADSENIILAKKEEDKCYYVASGIEDTDFIKDVCKIIEGGQSALKKRGIKFNLPIIKDLERGESIDD